MVTQRIWLEGDAQRKLLKEKDSATVAILQPGPVLKSQGRTGSIAEETPP